MLTQDQIKRLKPFIEHPKFGKLLKNAIKIWNQKDIIPSSGIFGVSVNKSTYKLEHKKCCLLGASLINKQNQNTPLLTDAINHIFEYGDPNIPYAMFRGFDQVDEYVPDMYQDAYNFGKEVSLVLFGDLNVDK